jgi:hypothetical protein
MNQQQGRITEGHVVEQRNNGNYYFFFYDDDADEDSIGGIQFGNLS